MNIPEKLSSLRQLMRQEGIDAFIFPSTDPHNGEYVPDHWMGRQWISGFNGSAGTAVVTLNEAGAERKVFQGCSSTRLPSGRTPDISSLPQSSWPALSSC